MRGNLFGGVAVHPSRSMFGNPRHLEPVRRGTGDMQSGPGSDRFLTPEIEVQRPLTVMRQDALNSASAAPSPTNSCGSVDFR